MRRQTRSDVAASRYKFWSVVTIIGSALLWVTFEHRYSLVLAAVGVAATIVGGTQLYRRRSRSLIEVCNHRFVDPVYHEVEMTVAPVDVHPVVETFSEDVTGNEEVESVTVRPSPNTEGQVVELQLNGGRMSASLATVISKSDGTPKLRTPTSEDYYRLFIQFDL
ncbi:hypothetical protein [Halomicrobium urmianum]|uniref:hypothetical protein n=1 Tax=Halomicrobium urmianum TaxID=1586233 RepID=UPI001CD9AF8E|nr:hypothetical protein [Halomicrobium urmianum]